MNDRVPLISKSAEFIRYWRQCSILYQASWRLDKSKETELAHVQPAIWSNSPDWLSPRYRQAAQTHLRLACNRNRFIWLIPFSGIATTIFSTPIIPFYLYLSPCSFFCQISKYPPWTFVSVATNFPLYQRIIDPLFSFLLLATKCTLLIDSESLVNSISRTELHK